MIYLDPRTGSGDLISEISPKPQLITLNSGDVMSTGRGPKGMVLWGVEIKKIGDALACMIDGRLLSQLTRMHEDYEYVYLLIEGEIRCDELGYLQQKIRKKQGIKNIEFWGDCYIGNKKRVLYTAFVEWLFSMDMFGGAKLLKSRDRRETGAIVQGLYKWWNKKWDDHSSAKQFDTSSQPTLVRPSVVARVAKELAEGIGWEKAMLAAEHFGTVKEMVNANPGDWKKIKGIDKTITDRVMVAVDEKHKFVGKTIAKKEKEKEKAHVG